MKSSDTKQFFLFFQIIVSTSFFIFLFVMQSPEYILKNNQGNQTLITFDKWTLVPLLCAAPDDCIETKDSLVTPFFNDERLREFRQQAKTDSFRIKTKLSEVPHLEKILKSDFYSIVVPKTETSSVYFGVLNRGPKRGALSMNQVYNKIPIFFNFESKNFEKGLTIDDEIGIDFHLVKEGALGTKNFPIGFVIQPSFVDFFNAVNPAASQDQNGELPIIIALFVVVLVLDYVRMTRNSQLIKYLFFCVSLRAVVVYFLENGIFSGRVSELSQLYVLLQLLVAWRILSFYLESHSFYVLIKHRFIVKFIVVAAVCFSVSYEQINGFVPWIQWIWVIDPLFNMVPIFIVLLSCLGVLRKIWQKKNNNVSGLFRHFVTLVKFKPVLFILNLVFVIFSAMQLPLLMNRYSISLPYAHSFLLFSIFVVTEVSIYLREKNLRQFSASLDKDSVIQAGIESFKSMHTQPFLAYTEARKREISLLFLNSMREFFPCFRRQSITLKMFQSPFHEVLRYNEFTEQNLNVMHVMGSLFPTNSMQRSDIFDFVMVHKNQVAVSVFSGHSLKGFPYFSICFDLYPFSSFGRKGEHAWVLRAMQLVANRIDLLMNQIDRIFYENDPVLKHLGYQSLTQVKPDFTLRRYLPALMIDVRGYSKLIVQKSLGCYDTKLNPVDINHSQILNVLFRPFLDLAYKNKMTRIGPNGDSLILFGPVDEAEPLKALIMLKTALDASEIYHLHLEDFKHFYNLHADSVSQITLQFGRALGFGEINVNLIGGSYTGQLDYHAETINLLARVEKFTKKINADFLMTQDFLDELHKETQSQPDVLHDIVIRYLGAFEFDASAQRVKLYQVGYAHKLGELFHKSVSFDAAVVLFDAHNYAEAILQMKCHLAIFPRDTTALALQEMCMERLN